MMELFVMAVCVIINALLAGIEVALLSVNRPTLREITRTGKGKQQETARLVLRMRENPERALSIIQVGITLVGAIAAAVGGASASEWLDPYLVQKFAIKQRTAEALSIIMVVLPLTFVGVVFGEIVPKTIALRNPLRFSLAAATGLHLADRILRPVVSTLEWSSKSIIRIVNKIFRVKSHAQEHATGSEVSEALPLEQVSRQTREYIINLVEIEKKRVRDIMLPWSRVIRVSVEISANDVEGLVLSSGHTRLPVVRGDECVGILNTKEFLAFHLYQRITKPHDWLDLIRPIVTVHASDGLLATLRLMQQERSHLSLVVDRGVRTGIITMEDIFEEVIGDVYDEDDDKAVVRMIASAAVLRKPRRNSAAG